MRFNSRWYLLNRKGSKTKTKRSNQCGSPYGDVLNWVAFLKVFIKEISNSWIFLWVCFSYEVNIRSDDNASLSIRMNLLLSWLLKKLEMSRRWCEGTDMEDCKKEFLNVFEFPKAYSGNTTRIFSRSHSWLLYIRI